MFKNVSNCMVDDARLFVGTLHSKCFPLYLIDQENEGNKMIYTEEVCP